MRRRKGGGQSNFGVDIMPSFSAYRRIMLRRLGRLPRLVQMFVVTTLVLSVVLYAGIIYSILSNPFKSDNFTERDKCAACYGTHMCADFYSGQASFSGPSRLRFLHFLNVKNVFSGYYGDKEVVFKRLAHTSELQAFDERMCLKAGYPMDCNTEKALRKHSLSGNKWLLDKVKGQSDLMMCPSNRLLETIMHHYVEKIDAVDLSMTEKLQLITTLLINPEPIILQTFSQKQGYPFPKYYGACGRMVVEEYIGHSLAYYYDSPWEARARLAYQILKIAEKFTDNVSQFGIYWTDLVYENFAVDRQGQVRIIDAENIIVVDKWQLQKDKKPGWDEPYFASFDECKDRRFGTCLSVYPDLLCERYETDFNYYVACHNLLSSYANDGELVGGLLHDIPQDINDRYGLEKLLNECARPTEMDQRAKIKDELLEILKTFTNRGYS